MHRRDLLKLTSVAVGGVMLPTAACETSDLASVTGLWGMWDAAFGKARYISLSHVLTPEAPLWKGFPPGTRFARGSARLDEKGPYTPLDYKANGFETTAYTFVTDQYGTQLDPPAHWHPCYPAIDEVPATVALRKLVVISIADKVHAEANYHLAVGDIRAWESRHGAVPAGSVVMVRSDWYKRWPDAARFQPEDGKFPGVSLDALKLLHLERKVLLHGHEPLDTDSTPTLIGEDWLMNNGYLQVEGVANLDTVPETGALIAIGFPRLKGGTGGFVSLTAICPSEWPYGVQPGSVAEAPLPYADQRLVWNDAKGVRERSAPCDKASGQLSLN